MPVVLFVLAVGLLAAVVVGLMGPAGFPGAGYQAGWVGRAVRSRLFITCGIVALVCLVAVMMTVWMLLLAGARQRRRRGTQEAAAIIEFALALPILLMLVLIMVQSSLLMGGNLAVHYAAFCAARSAVVSVPADLGPFEPPNVVAGPNASGKHRRMKLAAVWAVMPVSCSNRAAPPGQVPTLTEGLSRFFRLYGLRPPGWLGDYLGRKMRYAEDYTFLELAPPDSGGEYREDEDLHVSVTHTFYMSVPYANRLFTLLDRDDGVTLGFAQGEYGMIIRAGCTLTNEGVRDFVDTESFGGG